jgi:hypothetical protein
MVEHQDPFYQGIAKTIEEHGCQIIYVDGEARKPAFAYTIGNHLQGYPEFLMIGSMAPNVAQAILNHLVAEVTKARVPFRSGAHPNIGGKLDLQIWDTTAIAKVQYTIQCTEFYHHSNYAVQQVLVPDPKGHYPTDKRCHKRYRVPVLRPTQALMQAMQSTQVH